MKQVDPLDNLDLRPLDQTGIRILVDWARQEGWNPGPYDADIFWATDPEGFVGIYDGDTMVGGGAIVRYTDTFGFMGLFIVRPEYRSRGIGRQLWYARRDRLLARLEPDACIGMDGVVAMQPFYAQGGFVPAYREVRYCRVGERLDVDPRVSPISGADWPAILAYDEAVLGYARPAFLRPWLALPGNKAFRYDDARGLRGIAVVRKAHEGWKIGPLFADDVVAAEALYRACLNAVPCDNLYCDVPMANPAAASLLERYGAKYVFECARMYYGAPPLQDVGRIFGVTSFELG
jgi:GNAT superfamily N-acetyltransferase